MNLIDRELKLLFTSPLFIGLELAPAVLIVILILNYGILQSFPTDLLTLAWVMVVLYSTFFELEIWRREFLKKGVKLKLYVNVSEYTPFLAHSLVSLILLELKTLIVLMPSITVIPGQLGNLAFFLLATHGNWLFSLSLGYILSKEVFRSLADSTAVFLCMLIFSVITIIVVNQSSQSPYWPSVSPRLSDPNFFFNLFVLVALLLSIPLYVLALYACLLAARNIRIDDI